MALSVGFESPLFGREQGDSGHARLRRQAVKRFCCRADPALFDPDPIGRCVSAAGNARHTSQTGRRREHR
jgi:hypothetical protein